MTCEFRCLALEVRAESHDAGSRERRLTGRPTDIPWSRERGPDGNVRTGIVRPNRRRK
jgi:hypothetical protein